MSARHVSFLETGRSGASAEMVLRLASALGVPLRQVNAMLRAAGHEAMFDETEDGLPTVVADVIALLKSHHEPFPLIVIDRTYRVLDANAAAARMLAGVAGAAAAAAGSPTADAAPEVNLARLTFSPAVARTVLVNFDEIGREMLWRIQREVLADPDDGALRDLLDDLLAAPTVDPDWRHVDLSVPSAPALVVHLRVGDTDLRFLTAVTAFQAPQNVAVDQLRIETWLPVDEMTADACRAAAAG